MYNKIKGHIVKFCRAISMGAVAAILVIMFIVVIDIILRYVTAEAAIRGTYELSEMAMVIIIFLSLAVTQIEKEHIRVTLIIDKLPFRARAYEDAVVSAVMAVMAFITFYAGILLAMDNFQSGQYTAVLYIPRYPFALIMSVGLLALTIAFAFDTVDYLIKGSKKSLVEGESAS